MFDRYRALIEAVRKLQAPLMVDLNLILASLPDFPEIQYDDLRLRNVSYNSQSINGTLAVNEILLNRFPAHIINPIDYPAAF